MKLEKLFDSKKFKNAYRLNQKLELAEHILNHGMAPRKKTAILKFLKGMFELSKKDEKIFDKRLAEMIAEHNNKQSGDDAGNFVSAG